ncbi:TPA: hypothetical protein KKW95_001779 [Legionella pneumophila]|uniref:hypothetical protein n=1 Tax=Legionella pneumophila TaxID=446 RepID=UPI000B03F772|nr:hypothetical protein [Legionella pneumophila]STY00333.1 Uncharacterised protein [Legionella pneumophila]HAT1775047.1 hypothetical protein [Legionella pneumophila]HAT1778390.1 hypothetical protein [Legionella pneumophila]HAT2018914.1 hypothetical protein [Legionella pneumophila]HAT2024698.1 hypothetical protein [Legionella pneumophila]
MMQHTKFSHENQKDREKVIITKRHASKKEREDVTERVISKFKNALEDLAKR